MRKSVNLHPTTGNVNKADGTYVNIPDLMTGVGGVGVAVAPIASVADQAGRTRISQPIPLGDYRLTFNRLPQFFDTVTSGAEVAYNESLRSHHMTTTTEDDYAIVQTYQAHNYFAGKSQFVEFTCFGFHDQPNIEKRYGYYNSVRTAPYQANLDGFYLYTDGTGHYLRIMNNGTEILNVPQSEWDDPLDGTGASGYEIDWSKFNVFQFSFLWLGGTGLRFSIVVGANIIQVHNYSHVGSANSDKLIFSRPSRPIRMEIIQSGAGSGVFDPVCSTVITEGSEASGNVGEVIAIDTPAANTIQLSYPQRGVLKGFRLKETAFDTVVDLLGVDTFATTTNDFYKWELVLNPSLVDGDGNPKTLIFTDVTNRAIEQTVGDGATFAVGGTVVESGFGGSRSISSASIESSRKIGASIAGVADEMYLVVSPLQGTTNIQLFGSINLKLFV